jgi:Trypsin
MEFFEVLPWLLLAGVCGAYLYTQRQSPGLVQPVEAPQAGPKTLKVPEIIPNVGTMLQQRSVKIRTGETQGNGMLLDGDYVLTAQHVVYDSFGRVRTLKGFLALSHAEPVYLEVIASNVKADLALCKIKGPRRSATMTPLRVTTLQPGKTPNGPFSKVYLLLLNETSGPRWARIGLGEVSLIQDFVGLFGGARESSRAFTYGDSGTVALDALGRIATVVSGGPRTDITEGVVAVGASPDAVRIFLKTHWPNYQG